MAARVTEWFVEPKDGFSNEVIFTYLADLNAGSPDNTMRGLLDNKGNPHDVIQVEHRVVTVIEKNRQTFGLAFKVYNRRQGDSFIREWRFGSRSPFHARKELTQHLRRLEQLNKNKK